MERLFTVKRLGGEVNWHPRKKLHPHMHQATYFEPHPNLALKLAISQRRMEETIHDILHGSTPADLQRLEIKHMTGEK